MRLYVVRHGETVNNTLRKVSGRSETSLTERGIKQAQELGDKLFCVHFDFAFSSPLSRAYETAREITDLPIVVKNIFIERNYGKNEGKLICDTNPKELWDYNLNFSGYGVECVLDVLARARKIVDDFSFVFPSSTILLVTHSGLARAIYYVVNGIPDDGDLLKGDFPNCGYQVYDL